MQIKRENESWRYYICENGKARYLNKSESGLISGLEYKNYYTTLARTLDNNLKALKKMQKVAKSYQDPKDVFFSIPEHKRHLIKPYLFQIKKIKALIEEYGPESYYDRDALLRDPYRNRNRPTKIGYLVRSKAEEDIADAAYERGMFFMRKT